MQGVDAAHLVLTDTDLSDCLFSGAFHLDQLRLEGAYHPRPHPPPASTRRGIAPIHWHPQADPGRGTPLARPESRTAPPHPRAPCPSPRRWRTGPHHPDPARTPRP
ncbi:hypothetical protein Shyd_00140 [Streptomyces hydrogenans]|uniref:Uncharacterized protein n=1 Tax=Streptomyces hydrogenans TaxID=1873719 RepID=A0ABQ3P0T5_9ACTN|nr:hypothetical protein Shyd_00140 [Streptomyces hydrogenans]